MLLRRTAAAVSGMLMWVACEADDQSVPAPTSQAPKQAMAEEAPPREPAPSRLDDPAFTLEAQPAPSYAQGTEGTFAVVLTTKPPWHVNEDFPLELQVQPVQEVEVSDATLDKKAAEVKKESARFEVPVTPKAQGKHRVEATMSFAVCTDEQCIPDERTVAAVLPVQ